MAILSGDIKLMKSEVMLDTVDGGGKRASGEIVDGQENNLFPDISELDRTYGRIALRKFYPSILTTNTDSYYGSHVIVAKPPADPRVSVCLFSTASWFDVRSDARNRLETYLAPSSRWAGHLLETQLQGARAIQQCLKPGDPLPEVGRTLYLVQDEGKSTQFFQYVRVTKVEAVDKEFTNVNGTKWKAVVCTITVSDPLRYTFEGLAPTPFEYDMAAAKAKTRDTLVADASKYYSIAHLTQATNIGDLTIKVDNIYGQLVPSAQTEIPLVDLGASGQSQPVLQSGTDQVVYTIAYSFGAGKSLYLGTGVVPGTLQLVNGATTLTDELGAVKASGSDVGSIDYTTGIITFVSGSWAGTTTVKFYPAAAPSRVVQTACLHVSQNDRGYTWTINLNPPPPPKSLIVAYMVQGKWYELRDQGPVASGTGKLAGGDSSVGTGSINYSTGSVVLSLGALPDADSQIMFAWATKGNYFDRSKRAVPAPYFMLHTANPGVIPGQCTVSWPNPSGSGTISVTDNGHGVFSNANASGTIRYQTGEIKLTPAKVPLGGTIFTVNYAWGNKAEATFAHPIRDGSGYLSITTPDNNLIPGTLEVEWNTLYMDYDAVSSVPLGLQVMSASNPRDPTVIKTDIPRDTTYGDLKDKASDSEINYVDGTIYFNPDGFASIPKPVYSSQFIGFQAKDVAVAWSTWNGRSGVSRQTVAGDPMYRNTLTGISYQQVAVLFPSDESGYVKVRYLSQQSANVVQEQYTFDKMRFDLTDQYAEKIVMGSTRFVYGTKTFVDRIGQLYCDIDPATGSGTLAGNITYGSGAVEVSVFPSGANNTLTVQSLLTEQGNEPCDYVIFRIPAAPVRSGSFQIRGTRTDGTTFNITAGTNGKIEGDDVAGNIDYLNGIVEIRFGGIDHAADYQNTFFYNPSQVINGTIFVARPVWGETLRYNAVSYSYLPLNADILGLDPVRLPSDGRVPVFRIGDVAVVHHTAEYQLANPAPNAAYNVGRERVASIKVVDSAGKYVPDTKYTTNLDAGTITLAADFSTSGFTAPFYAEHRIEDMAVLQDVQLNGTLTLTRTITHQFPASGAYVSSALIIGDMQARAHTLFSQATWDATWNDVVKGSSTTAKFNNALFPIQMTNKGSIQERWACIFTSSTNFRVVGEFSGEIIASQATGSDCAPLNPATNAPYFVIPTGGWGTGWAAGNVLRFNTAAANYPVWAARTVLQGPPSEDIDGFQLQVRGDIDR